MERNKLYRLCIQLRSLLSKFYVCCKPRAKPSFAAKKLLHTVEYAPSHSRSRNPCILSNLASADIGSEYSSFHKFSSSTALVWDSWPEQSLWRRDVQKVSPFYILVYFNHSLSSDWSQTLPDDISDLYNHFSGKPFWFFGLTSSLPPKCALISDPWFDLWLASAFHFCQIFLMVCTTRSPEKKPPPWERAVDNLSGTATLFVS